jgi:fructokinase
MTDLTALGELLIDFTPEGVSSNGMPLFSQNPGGAVANVACTVSRLGRAAAFIGKVGEDMHGRFLRKALIDAGVDTSGLILDERYATTLAFVSLTPDGDREFSFYRDPGADTCLFPEEVEEDLILGSRILHVGSLSMTDRPASDATRKALQTASAAKVTVSFDPNYRERLWHAKEAAITAMREILPFAKLVKLSDEEAKLLFGINDPFLENENYFTGETQCLVITMGDQGAIVHTAEGSAHIPAYPADPVDTTGAGDIFWGAFLYAYLEDGGDDLSLKACVGYTRFANAAAALSVGMKGAIPSIPSRQDIYHRMDPENCGH